MKRFSFNMILLTGILVFPIGGILVPATSTTQIIITAGADEVELAHGVIRNVDAERNTFELAVGEEGEEVTISVTDRTLYTLDGEESTMEEALREGREADVTHRNNVAVNVDVRTRAESQLAMAIFADFNIADDDVEIVSGSIKRVDDDLDELTVSTGVPGEEVTVHLTDETIYSLDGEESTKRETLRVGRRVDVRHRNHQALRVDAKTESTQRSMLADDEADVARGRVQSVDSRRSRFVLSTEDDEEVTFRINAQTRYTLDGEESTRQEALLEGRDATVIHRTNLAIRVDALTRTD